MLVNNNKIQRTLSMAEQIAANLQSRGIIVEVDNGENPVASFAEVDSIIVLGGDGTIVRAARQHLDINVPILGVNMGTVGFLSNLEADELDQYLDRFLQKDYHIDERMMLEVEILRDRQTVSRLYGLNEACVQSHEAHLIDLDMRIAGEGYGNYRADGLIIATPTGSTGYSLSCGGPIVDPQLESFIITPIASYLLAQRPLVISAGKDLCLKLVNGTDTFISMDGQVKVELKKNDTIIIKRAGTKLKLVNLKPRDFFATVDSRLKRNKDG
ncbi:MAG: NAD(+)/NADH kinase [Bacillota bacterium]|nr:NAD(+)/NADH kinase [Bacillota bacterium]